MLSFPSAGTLNSNDYVMFSHYIYKEGDAGTPPAQGQIRLYMPNSTPNITNHQGWGEASYPGPFGEAQVGLATAAGQGIGALAGGGSSKEEAIESLKKTFTGAREAGRGIVGQALFDITAAATGLSANHITSRALGKVYNPNTELFYNGPGLRTFSMGFNFIPKNEGEARMIDNIIMEFKKWSSPATSSADGMFEIPHIWSVRYVTNGTINKMNRFKPAALSDVTVQANPTLQQHSTFTDGSPVEKAISLSFKEVELITREDHEEVGGQGF